MENNNSKQAILSIVGIAILVIAVVGVSFAFFTYSRTGTSNNTITTGSITFDLKPGGEDGESNPKIDGKDTFPQDDDDGQTNPKNETDFDVSGTIPTGAGDVKYVVYAIKGTKPETEAPGGEWHELEAEDIKMLLTVTGAESSDITNNYATANNPGEYTVSTGDQEDTEKGFILATGTIKANGTPASHKYKLFMWATTSSHEGKLVSDTDNSYKYRASSTDVGDKPAGVETDNRKVWSDMYYAVKIKVVASDDPSFNPAS